MYRMNKTIVVFIFFLYQFCFSQGNEENTYILFDTSSKKEYFVEVDGKMIKEKFYRKGINKNGNITFSLGKEMLSFIKKDNKIDSCRIEYLKIINISNIDNLIKKVNNTNPLYPYKVFPNLFLVEKINDTIIVKYKVKWEYYIE